MIDDVTIAVTMATLESHNHIPGDIERGVKIFKSGVVEFVQDDPTYFRAIVPRKGADHRSVSITFSKDGNDLYDFYCGCTHLTKKHGLLCCHVVATVLSIQGGVISSNLTIGKEYGFEEFVTDKDTAKAMGSGHLEVFATPTMIAWMELAAYRLLEVLISEGQTSVGTNICVSHTAATPVGLMIETKAKIISVKGRTVTFEVSACDGYGEIGRGTHTRVIVDEEKFMKKAQNKKT